jgi:hypothetical protein
MRPLPSERHLTGGALRLAPTKVWAVVSTRNGRTVTIRGSRHGVSGVFVIQGWMENTRKVTPRWKVTDQGGVDKFHTAFTNMLAQAASVMA